MKQTLEEWITAETKKYRLWAFLDRYGGGRSRYNAGYLQCLEDVKAKTNECEQLTLF